MISNYTSYKEYLLRTPNIANTSDLGIGFYFKRNKIKVTAGITCIILGSIRGVPFFLFYPLGFFLLGMSAVDIPLYRSRIIRYIRKIYILKRGKVL